MMLRYLMLSSFQIRYLLWESWVLWFKEKTPENRNSTGSKWKEAGFPANTNKFKALKSCLPHKNAPKCRFWALAIWNNVQIPQGRYWRRYLFYWWNRHERNASNIAKKNDIYQPNFVWLLPGLNTLILYSHGLGYFKQTNCLHLRVDICCAFCLLLPNPKFK